MRRWENRVLAAIRANLDPKALGGKAINSSGLAPLIFDANPASHTVVGERLRARHSAMSHSAHSAGRLPPGTPLVSRWTLTYDIYSPKLRRFIEVDERQHFSSVRLARIGETRPLYPAHFWATALHDLVRSPATDRDPPHRDEARAYGDEARELLPVAYGLEPTIRLDEFSLSRADNDLVALIDALC